MNWRRRMAKVLLWCGIVTTVLWIGTDVAAALRYAGYSYADYSVSELSAIGAPTRALVSGVGFVTVVLQMAFAVGVWLAASAKQGLRIAAALLFVDGAMNVALAVVNLVTPFAVMHTREALATAGQQRVATDTMHLVYAAVTVVLILSMIGFAAGAFGRGWRWYSIATIVAALAFGAWAGTFAPLVAANLPTPGLGLIERVNVYSFYVWMALLSVMLLRRQATGAQDTSGGRGQLDGVASLSAQ